MPQEVQKRLFVYYGSNDYLKDLNARRIARKFKCDKMNVYQFTASDDMLEVLADMAQPSLFGEEKVLIFTNTGLFSSKAIAQEREESLCGYLTQLAEDENFTLIFKENEFDKRKKLAKLAVSLGETVSCEKMEQPEKLKIITSFVKSQGATIQTAAAVFLLSNTIDDMQNVLRELEKLCLYVGPGGDITVDHVKKICTLTVNARIFDLNDALADRKMESALSLMNSLSEDKQNISMMLVMIPRNWMMMYDVKLYSENKLTNQEIMANLGIAPNMSFVVQKLIRQSKGYSFEELFDKIKRCCELDEAVKNGLIKDTRALELMIFA